MNTKSNAQAQRRGKGMAGVDYCELTFTSANNYVHVSHHERKPVLGKCKGRSFFQSPAFAVLRRGRRMSTDGEKKGLTCLSEFTGAEWSAFLNQVSRISYRPIGTAVNN